jgi:D-glycero-D-manno-heptose 1,7-bisphosphate phosphatase
MEAKRRALFLDRDGVINIDHGYVYRQDQFEFVDGIFELARAAVALDYLVFVVTNQAGIGRGYFTEQQFHELTLWMCRVFLDRGVKIERVYFCPFHPEHGVGDYKRESSFRKPGPGMILQAARDFDLDLAGSVLVGDNETDIAAGLAAGVGRNILYGPRGHGQLISQAIVMDSLPEIANWLAGYSCQ